MFDFNRITQETDLYNLHTHTQFCDGHAAMEEFVVEAIASGITHLGFSPHSPLDNKSSRRSINITEPQLYNTRMRRMVKAGSIPAYAQLRLTVSALQCGVY